MTQDLAQKLWTARESGGRLPSALGDGIDGEAAAYAIQAETAAISGQPVTGWKIGATSEALFPVLGLDGPFVGPLYDAFTHASGDTLRVGPGRALETEVTVRLGTALPARSEPYTRGEIEDAVAAVIPSFEVVGARFDGEFAGAGLKLIADGGANVGTVLGPEFSGWRDLDLTDLAVSLSLDDDPPVTGNSSALLWDHVFDALIWVLQLPALRHRGLRANDLIMTGTCTGITPLDGVCVARATIAGIGSVEATLDAT